MRILVLTNFYPPHSIGGMGLSCQETVQALWDRGHTVRILTSKHGVRGAGVEENIARVLNLEMELSPLRNAWRILLRRRADLDASRSALRETVGTFDPEVVFIWGMWNLPRKLAADAEEMMQGRVVYRFADYWPTLASQHVQYWQAPGRTPLSRLARRVLAPLVLRILGPSEEDDLRYPHAYCVSGRVRARLLEHGIPVAHAAVIHSGIDLGRFNGSSSQVGLAPDLLQRILYVGRISPEKGLFVLLRALERLAAGAQDPPWSVTIAGGGDPDYVSQVTGMADRLGLDKLVKYLGERPTHEIPELMHQHGVVVIPSLWEEPLPRTALEAMASGRLVVASRIGGLPELVSHGRTGLLTRVGDPEDLAETLEIACTRPGMAQRLAEAGRRSVEARFTISQMVEQVEDALNQAARHVGPNVETHVAQQWADN